MLNVIELQTSASLRQRMEQAGCAFDFLVLAPDASETVDEALHRQAGGGLSRIATQRRAAHVILVDPGIVVGRLQRVMSSDLTCRRVTNWAEY